MKITASTQYSSNKSWKHLKHDISKFPSLPPVFLDLYSKFQHNPDCCLKQQFVFLQWNRLKKADQVYLLASGPDFQNEGIPRSNDEKIYSQAGGRWKDKRILQVQKLLGLWNSDHAALTLPKICFLGEFLRISSPSSPKATDLPYFRTWEDTFPETLTFHSRSCCLLPSCQKLSKESIKKGQ